VKLLKTQADVAVPLSKVSGKPMNLKVEVLEPAQSLNQRCYWIKGNAKPVPSKAQARVRVKDNSYGLAPMRVTDSVSSPHPN